MACRSRSGTYSVRHTTAAGGPLSRLPRTLKLAHTAFVVGLVPAYWRNYGPGNFLWFSDMALLVSVPALWLESPLLAGSQAVGVLVPEALWMADYGSGLLTGRTPIGLASYMFDRRLPRSLRALSLFHLWLTPLLVLVVSRVGYDRRSWRVQAALTPVLIVASWRLTDPTDNVNWVHSGRDHIRTPAARALFVALLAVGIPLALQLPVHRLFRWWFPEPSRA